MKWKENDSLLPFVNYLPTILYNNSFLGYISNSFAHVHLDHSKT